MANKQDFERIDRLSVQIQRAFAPILETYLLTQSMPMVSITDTKVTKDLSLATIYISTLDSTQAGACIKCLNKGKAKLRYQLTQSLNLRVSPALRFLFDKTLHYGNKLTQLINDAVADDEKRQDSTIS